MLERRHHVTTREDAVPHWLTILFKKRLNHAAADDDAAQPRIRDADGRQLAQIRTAMRDELEWLESASRASADLTLESTEHVRARRARTRKKR